MRRFALAALLLAAIAHVALADEQPGEKITTSSKTRLTVDRDRAGPFRAELNITNDSNVRWTLSHVLKSFGFRNVAEKPVESAISVTGAQTTLAPGDTEHLVFEWKTQEQVLPGTYQGVLETQQQGYKQDTKSKPVTKTVRYPLEVVVIDVGLVPLASRVDLRAFRLVPFSPFWWPFTPTATSWAIPLRSPVDPDRANLTKKRPLASLWRDVTGNAILYYDGDADALRTESAAVGLQVPEIPHTGKYTGTVSFASDKSQDVTVNLNATDLFVYPMLWLMVGVWIANRGKQYLTVGRQILQWRAQLAKAREDYKQESREFADRFRGTPSASYSAKEDFGRHALDLDTQLTRAQSAPTLDPAIAATVTVELAALAAVPEKTRQLSVRLEELRKLKDESSALSYLSGLANPAVMTGRIDALLVGKALNIADLDSQITQLMTLRDAVRLWSSLWRRTEEVSKHFAEFGAIHKGYVKKNEADVDEIRKAITAQKAALWSISDDAAAMQLARSSVEELEKNYSLLVADAERVAATRAHGTMRFVALQADSEEIRQIAPPVALSEKRAEDTHTAAEYLRAIQKHDRALGYLAYVLAVVSGLAANYFGKNFGTLQDYANLLLWAFGTKVAVDMLAGALERLPRPVFGWR